MHRAHVTLAASALLALCAYAALALASRAPGPATGWLLGAQAAGWLALAAAWRLRNEDLDTPVFVRLVVAAAVAFRLAGLTVVPGWEDDYFRHLWDGWLTWRTGSPYGVAPLAWFGADGVPPRMEAVLDGINHPEHATIYGPVAQAWAAVAAGLGEGKLWVFKIGLLAAEAVAWLSLWRLGGSRALLFAAWCPLVVTEIAFAGHVDALLLPALALALAARARRSPLAVGGWLALAVATKAYALLLAPFFLLRGGWRGWAILAGGLIAAYAPWLIATHAAGRPAAGVWGGGGVGAMAGSFEFNSTGYALLAWACGADTARSLAAACLLAGLVWLAWRVRAASPHGLRPASDLATGAGPAIGPGKVASSWASAGPRHSALMAPIPPAHPSPSESVTNLGIQYPESSLRPVIRGGQEGAGEVMALMAVVVGWWALWSPVFHPWYALVALPFLALRPTGWGVGLLVALPLSYLHGLAPGAGVAEAGTFRHAAWVRPAEVVVVLAGALAAWAARRRPGADGRGGPR